METNHLTGEFWNLCRFKGYGNPDAPIWFIGIEDGGEGWSHQDIITRVRNDYSEAKTPDRIFPISRCQIHNELAPIDERTGTRNERKGTKIYRYMGYIVSMGKRPQSKDVIFDTLAPAAGPNTYFQMNLFPLGKKRDGAAFRPNYAEDFGLGTDDRQAHQTYDYIVRTERFDILREFWRTKKPRLTVAFGGSNHKGEIEELLNLDPKTAKPSDRVFLYKLEKAASVFWTPFFGQGLAYKALDPVVREWKRLSMPL